MDLICSTCGEPWDIDTVLHETPEDFSRRGCLITACPSCHGTAPEMPASQGDFLKDVAALAQLCGNDIDGFAAMLEDLRII